MAYYPPMNANTITKKIATLRFKSGLIKKGFVRSIFDGIIRITWTEDGSEGVDIRQATGHSMLGAWMLISRE